VYADARVRERERERERQSVYFRSRTKISKNIQKIQNINKKRKATNYDKKYTKIILKNIIRKYYKKEKV
jgi:hypothetical protein